MLIVGLTGGIASGKTAVAAAFVKRGVPVLDADRISHELTADNGPALPALRKSFGRDIFHADGTLDRAALRRRVFADDGERRRLEALLHPLIRAEMTARLARLDAPYAVLVIPLLFEAGQTDLVQRILVVDCPEEVQMHRGLARDGGPAETFEAILKAQWRRDQRLAAADDVLDNSGDMAQLERQVDTLHARYLQLAQRRI